MDGTDHAGLNWEWQNHELCATFDAGSPLGAAHTLWEDLIDKGEGETTPASKLSRADFDDFTWDFKAKDNPSIEAIHDDENLHLKRRRMLQFGVEEDIGLFACDTSLYPSPFDCLQSSDVLEDQGSDMLVPTSTTTMWFEDRLDDEDSFKIERCNNASRGYDPSEAKTCETLKLQGKGTICESNTDNAKCECKACDQEQSNKTPHSHKNLSGQSAPSNKMMIPIAYPFTVVKPSGIQGDVTLNDINKHIMMVHKQSLHSGQCHFEGDGSFSSSDLEKSVLALTKIHTHGNGTITIMRTKN